MSPLRTGRRMHGLRQQELEASGPTRVHRHVSDPGEGVKREALSRKHWTTLNRLRTGVGRYRSSMKKWGLADSAACECGEPERTASNIINSCPLHRPSPKAIFFEVGPLTRAWLQQTELTVRYDIHERRRGWLLKETLNNTHVVVTL